MRRKGLGLVTLLLLGILGACSDQGPGVEVTFVSPVEARVTYQGQTYVLVKGENPPPGFPFRYRFEEDGDLDLLLGGRWVEFDNPYDLDFEFTKKTKKTKKWKKRWRNKNKKRR